jgi:probable lipoprotein NlpC
MKDRWSRCWIGIGLALVALVAGCAGRKPETSTGLPYWPPGPLVLEAPEVRVVAPGESRIQAPVPLSADPVVRRVANQGAKRAPLATVGQTKSGLSSSGSASTGRPNDAAWRSSADRWIGVPYRLGGEDRTGVDCSAFTRAMYREVAGIDLPRSTDEQWKSGEPVDIPGVRAGDLVFFLPLAGESGVAHVGVMVDQREFAHAGTRGGVTYAYLEERYWRERAIGARRLLPWP